jgi:beta-glucosidase
MGAALVRGTQRYVMACAKHYALNSLENARFTVDVRISEADLHDVYLPHFKRTVDEGVAAIMSAYNSVNGEWAGQNRYLLTDVLRETWHWDGITVSDFLWGLRDAAASLEAGLDLEEPFAQQRAAHLPAALATGEASWDMVQRSGIRLLAAQLRSYAEREEDEFPLDSMADEEARALSRTVAARAMVLLRNEPVGGLPVLPLEPGITRIAVLGRLATAPNMGDHGSSDVRAPSSVSPADGIRAAYPDAVVTVMTDDDPEAAAAAARDADAAIVIVGFDAEDEGEFVGAEGVTTPELMALFPPVPEDVTGPDGQPFDLRSAVSSGEVGHGGDRASLELRPVDEAIIRAVAAENPRTVVSIVAAGAVLTEGWRHQVPAVLLQWYSGMEGGHALADVLSGRQNPSGRLPFSIPTSPEHLPSFDRDATEITYDRFHGQRLLDRLGVEAAYPHGFGLAYTTYELADAAVQQIEDQGWTVTVNVRNTGERDGRHTVQVYGHRLRGEHAGERWLVGFAGVEVHAGGFATVPVPISLTPLALWNDDARVRIPPDLDDVELEVGAHVHDPAAALLRLT